MSTHTQTIFFPSSALASFQEYLRPNGSIVNDSTCCSSYSRPIGGAWNSPKMEMKRRIAHKTCALYTGSKRTNLTQQEEDENGVIDTKSMRIHYPNKNARATFSDFSTLRPGLKKLRLQALFYRIHLDDQPKRCKTFAFTHKSVSIGMAAKLSNTQDFSCVLW